MTEEFRCAAASLADAEPMAGTAPEDAVWLFVEDVGPWGRKAVAESRLPEEVRAFLDGLDGVRVQLVRRHGGVSRPGVGVFAAHLGADREGSPRVWATTLDDVHDVLDLDVAALRAGRPDLPVHEGPLWLVCTNGRRDRCCAEAGRPIAAALSARWPDETWETTHLGGHRFAGTLLALPSGLALGRLDAGSAVAACKELEAGRLPLDHARGRAGRPPAVQVAELHLRVELDLDDAAPAETLSVDGDTVVLRVGGADYSVEIERILIEPRRQSCADLKTKAGWEHRVRSWRLGTG
ncbi:sucrase ferredoxin [Nocardioides ungokensis]|uniref:sucrase ferredoxin n=1 Tax=Nocardioides ungokensis TaxID=1643322 RepID=UPI0015DDA3C5|nr:sucrase ferredoxin [Nocardioides ungokensis]